MTSFRSAILFIATVISFSLGAQTSENHELLLEWISGEFATGDSGNLHVGQIWPQMPNGSWLYAETSGENGVAQQMVWFISEMSDDVFSLDIYNIPFGSEVEGAWKNPTLFEGKKPFDLKHRDGCTLFLQYDGFQFHGNTNEGTCSTDMGVENMAMSFTESQLNITHSRKAEGKPDETAKMTFRKK